MGWELLTENREEECDHAESMAHREQGAKGLSREIDTGGVEGLTRVSSAAREGEIKGIKLQRECIARRRIGRSRVGGWVRKRGGESALRE